jgi:hypothetical protein
MMLSIELIAASHIERSCARQTRKAKGSNGISDHRYRAQSIRLSVVAV